MLVEFFCPNEECLGKEKSVKIQFYKNYIIFGSVTNYTIADLVENRLKTFLINTCLKVIFYIY